MNFTKEYKSTLKLNITGKCTAYYTQTMQLTTALKNFVFYIKILDSWYRNPRIQIFLQFINLHRMNINTATLVDALLLLLLLFHVSAGPHFDKNPKRFSIKRHEFPEKPSKDLITHITISKIGTIEIGSFKEALSNIEGINNQLTALLNEMRATRQGECYKTNLKTVTQALDLTETLVQAMKQYSEIIKTKITEIWQNTYFEVSLSVSETLEQALTKVEAQITRQNKNVEKWKKIKMRIRGQAIKRKAFQELVQQKTEFSQPSSFVTRLQSQKEYGESQLKKLKQTQNVEFPQLPTIHHSSPSYPPYNFYYIPPIPFGQIQTPDPDPTLDPVSDLTPSPALGPEFALSPALDHNSAPTPAHSHSPPPAPRPSMIQPPQIIKNNWQYQKPSFPVSTQPSDSSSTSTSTITQQPLQQFHPQQGAIWRLSASLSKKQIQPIFQPQTQSNQVTEAIVIHDSGSSFQSKSQTDTIEEQTSQQITQITKETFHNDRPSRFMLQCHMRSIKHQSQKNQVVKIFELQKKQFQKVKKAYEANCLELERILLSSKTFKNIYRNFCICKLRTKQQRQLGYNLKRELKVTLKHMGFHSGFVIMLRKVLQDVKDLFLNLCDFYHLQLRDQFQTLITEVTDLAKKMKEKLYIDVQGNQNQRIIYSMPDHPRTQKVLSQSFVNRVLLDIIFDPRPQIRRCQSPEKIQERLGISLKDSTLKLFINFQKNQMYLDIKTFKQCWEKGKILMTKLGQLIRQRAVIETNKKLLQYFIERSTHINTMLTCVQSCKNVLKILESQSKNIQLYRQNDRDGFQQVESLMKLKEQVLELVSNIEGVLQNLYKIDKNCLYGGNDT